MEDGPTLVQMYHIIKNMVEINDRSLVEMLLNDTFFLSFASVLGKNPMLLHETDYRSPLKDMTFKEVVPVGSADIVNCIHLAFRLDFLKSQMAPQTSSEATVQFLSNFSVSNSYTIMNYLAGKPEYVAKMYVVS